MMFDYHHLKCRGLLGPGQDQGLETMARRRSVYVGASSLRDVIMRRARRLSATA